MDERLLLTREQSRRVDTIAIERYGIPGLVLMENAGRGVVDVLLEIDSSRLPAPSPRRGAMGRGELSSGSSNAPHTPPLTPPRRGEGNRGNVVILCGKGNNAGDGFVIARHLEIRGVDVRVVLLRSPTDLKGDARQNFEVLCRCDVPTVDLSTDCCAARLDQQAGGDTWLVDALLGAGAHGEPREPVRSAILWMNSQPARRLAVDLPSGLDCDTGRPASATVRADVTCTFVAAKVGLVRPEARQFVGDLRVVSIGAPPRLVREVLPGESSKESSR